MGENAIDPGRRRFLTGRSAQPQPEGVRPPWSRATSIAGACTGCGACVPACPQHIIALDAGGRPILNFAVSECSFCGACAETCPEPVFDRLLPAFEHVATVGSDCFAGRGIVCQSCGDACPESAIRFRPRLGGPALPEIAGDRCTGCGACIPACPAQAIAIGARLLESTHA
ncbi:MAG: ferredoxin-type protein NapF [Bosea sp.]|uniref:ferredoxin-type protein NapF n=1 Tax=Bosea sp. (in: a-proteobacteria) TaxID=1871050 RepID=UPI001AC5A112|nr:ferredoxin-type protein NapF [Bosea sp. (in: a-proteobacteria)]MBN9453547.1 ferredoxin-type protein NapF [Bosea sp. (in: a-proteobacteria)]